MSNFRSQYNSISGNFRLIILVVTAYISLSTFVLAQSSDKSYQNAKKERERILMDLGVVILPEAVDYRLAKPARQYIAGEAIGAAAVKSNDELRDLLNDLSNRINNLENSLELNEQIEAMQLENARLRELIKKSQTYEGTPKNLIAVPPQTLLDIPSDIKIDSDHEPLLSVESMFIANDAEYGTILDAFRRGNYQKVLALSPRLNRTLMSDIKILQVIYWRADALFRLGRFKEALPFLAKVVESAHPMKDDAIVLQGLSYIRLNEPGKALIQFEMILNNHPTSSYYRLAELTIKELNNNRSYNE